MKPLELSEEDWQHRIEKRRRAIAALKATEPYLRLSHGPHRPTTPDPADRSFNKRHWDNTVVLWKQALRDTDAAALPACNAAAPTSPVPAGSAAASAAVRSKPATRASAASARPRVETSRKASDKCRLETRKPAKKPFLSHLARVLLFVVVACAGLACDQLLFGDMVAPQLTECQTPRADWSSGSLKFDESVGASVNVGSVEAPVSVPESNAVSEQGMSRVNLAVD